MMVITIIIIPLLFSCASTQRKQTESRDADFYNKRGIEFGMKGQYDQAILDFNKALEINPGYADAYYNRGIVYYSKKEYAKSWDDIKKAQGLGGQVPPEFLEDLRKALGRQN